MAFQVSPGIYTEEFDRTFRIPSTVQSVGAIAGVFNRGPINTPRLVNSVKDLKRIFGKPYSDNYETWFTAYNYLSYAGSLWVTRVVANNTLNAVTTGTPVQILTREEALTHTDIGELVARHPGVNGNNLKISICPSIEAWSGGEEVITGISIANGHAYGTVTDYAKLDIGDVLNFKDSNDAEFNLNVTNASSSNVQFSTSYSGLTVSNISGTRKWGYITGISIVNGNKYGTVTDYAKLAAGDMLSFRDSTDKEFNIKVTNASSSNVQFATAYRGLDVSNTTGHRQWGYKSLTRYAPGENRVHIAIIADDGFNDDVPAGTVLEMFKQVSVIDGTFNSDNENIYYKDIINGDPEGDFTGVRPSAYVYATGATISASGPAIYESLSGGANDPTESNIDISILAQAYNLYANKNPYPGIRYILQGKPRGPIIDGTERTHRLANHIINNICEIRKDCVVYISPPKSTSTIPRIVVDDLKNFREKLVDSSYAFLDSGYKYQYDVYNKVYRWTPMNGDMAGLVARTSIDQDPWYSPAGYQRGKLKNVVKLYFNPNERERDELYPLGINPVITQRGSGTILFGDKTLNNADSAFDNINVRMLFITIEKAIERAARASLFEFNDAFTRAQFKNIVEPYLRDVQGRRGIYDFKVVCDETNNTSEVIDSNTFIGDIYVKPARSINYIKLNFVAVATGASFDEIVGNFY